MQVIPSGATDIAQLDAREVIPDALIRIEVRGIAGQLLSMQPVRRSCLEEVLDLLAAMERRTIPAHEDFAPDLAQQHAQETDDPLRILGRLADLHEESSIQGDAADHREMIARELDTQNRRPAARCPGAHSQR